MTAYLEWVSKPAHTFASDIQPSATECISSPHDVVATAAILSGVVLASDGVRDASQGSRVWPHIRDRSSYTHPFALPRRPIGEAECSAPAGPSQSQPRGKLGLGLAPLSGTLQWSRIRGFQRAEGPNGSIFQGVENLSGCKGHAYCCSKGHSGPSACAQVKDRPKQGIRIVVSRWCGSTRSVLHLQENSACALLPIAAGRHSDRCLSLVGGSWDWQIFWLTIVYFEVCLTLFSSLRYRYRYSSCQSVTVALAGNKKRKKGKGKKGRSH